MARIVKRLVKGTEYAYLEEDIYYGSRRHILRVSLGRYADFAGYDPDSREASAKIFSKILGNIGKTGDFYTLKHITKDSASYFEFARCLIKLFNKVAPPNEIKNYADHFYTQYAQGTSAIEGNTCTLRDTDLILNEGISVGGRELREIHEIENFKSLRAYVEKYSGDVTEEFIKRINEIILENLEDSRGEFRKVGVFIRGSNFEPPPAAVVEEEISGLLGWYKDAKEENLHPVEITSLFHQRFEEIHPFAEGNGRTGREILNFILRKNGLPAIFFGKPERAQYLNALDAGNNKNHVPLIKFVSWRVFESAKSYKKQVIDGYGNLAGSLRDDEKKRSMREDLMRLSGRLEDTIRLAEEGMMASMEKNAELD